MDAKNTAKSALETAVRGFVNSSERRGKTVYFCLRWEGSTGEKKGPFGEIYSGVIP